MRPAARLLVSVALLGLPAIAFGQQPAVARAADACVPIDFESVPGETPRKGLTIRAQFSASNGVVFALENGQPPRLAAVGRPQTAFAGPPRDTGADAPAAGANIGRFFLTDDGVLQGLTPPPLASLNKTYPVCRGAVQDSCQNPGEGGAPGRSRALPYWPGEPASERTDRGG